MDILKTLFPISYKKSDTVNNLVIGILIYVVIGIIAGALIALPAMLLGGIPVVGTILCWVLGIIGSLVGLYTLAGVVIIVLVYLKIMK
ncbi:MAG: hypothetical protein E7485_04640 [Ruminococcaceae bacterium]|nr:hypothetical protein [Oscillospiraceae bacterium]